MADIIYTYRDKVYMNITNRCPCRCTFCIRSNADGLGSSESLWHQKEPTLGEVLGAMDDFDFSPFDEVTFCGYGEPLCAFEILCAAGRHLKEKYSGIKIRINTNGLGDIVNGCETVPSIAEFCDTASISLNAADAEGYNEISRPNCGEKAFEAVLEYAKKCKATIPTVKLTVVDVISEDEIERCRKIANDLGVPLRVRRKE